MKQTNVCIIEASEGEDKGAEKLFKELIPKKFLNLWKETHTQIQEDRELQISGT